MPSILNSDDGVVSGTSGLKSTGGNDGLLNIQSNGSTVVAVTGSGISVTGTVSQTGVSTFAAGTVSAPSITFTGDTNTGIFSPAADTIAFTEGGAEAMRIDSSGNVGIGTSSPDYRLQIEGPGTGVTSRIGITNTTTGSTLEVGSDGNGGFIATGGAYGTLFYTNGAERMRIDSSGNVGIGTSSPSYKLDVDRASVGIVARFKGGTRSAHIYSDNDAVYFTSDTGVATAFGCNETSDLLTFYTGNTERARITSDGKFLIGNTDGGGLLTLGSSKLAGGTQQNAITSGTTGHWYASNSSGGTCGIQADFISSAGTAVFSLDSGTTNGYYFRTYDSGYDYRFRIAKSGSATNSTGSYGTISDARTKTVVGNASSQWDDIKQLNFIKYKLNKQVELEQSEENKDGYVAPVMLGLVAQEVEQICPGLIEESADPEFDQVKVIKTSILYMKAVKALQEAQLRIETLEAQNAAFEARLAALEAK